MELVNPTIREEDTELMLKEFLGEDAFQLSAYLERDLAALAAPDANEYQEVLDHFIPTIIDPLTKATAVTPEAAGLNWAAADQNVMQQQFQAQQFFQTFKPDLDAYDPHSVLNHAQPPPPPPSEPIIVNPLSVKQQQQQQQPPPQYMMQPSLQMMQQQFQYQPKPMLPPREEKGMKRKLQTRAASKLYRQRKKALEVQLTERLNQLEEEKQLLLQQQAAAEKLLVALREENAKLRQQQEFTSREVSKTRQDLLRKLASQVNEGADEETLRETLMEMRKCCSKCVEIGACSLKRLISSHTVEKLVDTGFFDDSEKMEILAKGRGSLSSFADKIKEEIKSLTPTQIATMDRVVLEKNEDFEVFYKERAELVQQIRTVFRNLKENRNDMNLMLESVRCLEHLRKNLQSEAEIWMDGYREFMSILSVLQYAQVALRVEYQFGTVFQLAAFWEALNKAVGNPTTSLCPSADSTTSTFTM